MSKIVFGVDVGGTTIKMGVFTKEGNLIEKWEIPTKKGEDSSLVFQDIAENILAKIQKLGYTKEDVIGVGVGIPGPVDDEGIVLETANIGWGRTNIAEGLEPLLGMPVKAANDANAAALGEMWQGGGKGFKNMVAVTLGTGVGGGVIVNGMLVCGFSGGGGEIGHINVKEDETESCGCGCKGCLEQYASATGIVRLAKRYLAENEGPTMLREGELSAKSIWDAVKAGDKAAEAIAEQFGHYLGKGLAAIAAVVNPEAFVIGGGVSKAGDILISYIRPNYDKYTFAGSRNAKFTLAKLGNDAGIYGAAKLVIGDR